MRPAIVSLGTTLSFLSLATTVQSAPLGSASSLSGLQERSVRQAPAPAPSTSLPNQNVRSNPALAGFRLNSSLQLRVSPERDKNLSGIYPEDSTATGNRIQLLYQIDPVEQK